MNVSKVDFVIVGAGIFGLHAATLLGDRGIKAALIEVDSGPLLRASYINQARVHNGYHYPRSVSTAKKSAHYFTRFNEEFAFAVHSKFRKIYAISKYDSLTNAEQFGKFCQYVGISAEEINHRKYFNDGQIEAAFETTEFTYDARMISDHYMRKLENLSSIDILFNTKIERIGSRGTDYLLFLSNDRVIQTSKVLNVTYASINQLHQLFQVEPFKTKYELCEVILTEVEDEYKNIGITVMDGPFFSMMPFGLTGYHSLTSVSYTPHEASNDILPKLSCQSRRPDCTPLLLQNCNACHARPESAWVSMKQQATKYLNSDIKFQYKKSLFAVKTILNSAELDDSRPTVIRTTPENPNFISVLSGKFNTIYDLEEVLT